MYALTSAERGKTHTVLICVSASGFSFPPLMVYPRKQRVPDNMREGAIPDTMFEVSESGWINQEIYTKWFDFFVTCSPFLYFDSTLVLLLMFVECDCRGILRACVCSLSGCLLL